MDVIITHPNEVIVYKNFFDAPIYHWKGRRRGLSVNFNDGVRHSSSPYLVRLDGFDESPYFGDLLFGVEILKHDIHLGAVAPFYKIEKDNEFIRMVTQPQGAGIIYKRYAFETIGGYDEKINLQADLDFYLKFIEEYNIGYYPGVYRWLVNQGSRSLDRMKMLSARKKVLHKHKIYDDLAPHFGLYHYL